MTRDRGPGGERSVADIPRIRVTLRLPPGSDCAQQEPPFPHGVAAGPPTSELNVGGGGVTPTHVQVSGSDGAVRRLHFSQVRQLLASIPLTCVLTLPCPEARLTATAAAAAAQSAEVFPAAGAEREGNAGNCVSCVRAGDRRTPL